MKTYHILTLLVIFLFTGCLKEEKMSIGALIKVNMPEGFENTSPEGIDVKLYSTTSGLTWYRHVQRGIRFLRGCCPTPGKGRKHDRHL